MNSSGGAAGSGAIANVPLPTSKWIDASGCPTPQFFQAFTSVWQRTGGVSAPVNSGTGAVGVGALIADISAVTDQAQTAGSIGLLALLDNPDTLASSVPDSGVDDTAQALALFGVFGDHFTAGQNAYAASTVSAPTAPASTGAYTMQGLAGAITPEVTGRVQITICGSIVSSSTTVGNGIALLLAYGSGSVPANGAALTGITIGDGVTYTQANAPLLGLDPVPAVATASIPFSITYIATGLTLGLPYWLDLAAEAIITASAVGIAKVSISAIEF